MGRDIWLDRLRVFCLWKKTKSCGSAFLRYRVDGVSIFYLKRVYACPFRCCIGGITFLHKNILIDSAVWGDKLKFKFRTKLSSILDD